MDKIEVKKVIENLSKVLKALSEPTGLKIVLLLSTSERCVNDIVKKIGLSQPVISHHSRIVCEAGFTRPVRRGDRGVCICVRR